MILNGKNPLDPSDDDDDDETSRHLILSINAKQIMLE